MKRWTLRRKIVSFVFLIMATFLAVRAVATANQSYNIYLHFAVEQARSTADTLAVAIDHGAYWGDSARMQGLLSALVARTGQHVQDMLVADGSGQVIAATDTTMIGTLLPKEVQQRLSRVIEQDAVEAVELPGADGTLNQVAVPIEIDGQPKGALIVQYSQDPAKTMAGASVKYEAFTFTVMAMGLALILLVGLRKMVLHPLAVLQEGAARFGRGDLDARIELKTGDELETVARAFNRMAGSLKAYQAHRLAQERQAALMQLACATARELSQPLTVVLGYTELLREQGVLPTPEFLDEALQSIHRGSRSMAGIVRQLSRLSDGHTMPAYMQPGAPAFSSRLGMPPHAPVERRGSKLAHRRRSGARSPEAASDPATGAVLNLVRV